MTTSRSLFLLFLVAILAALAASLFSCAGSDDEGGGRVASTSDDDTDDDDTDDDDDDDFTGDDDTNAGDCDDVIANPYCLDGVTFEMPGATISILTFRSLFIQFGDYRAESFEYDVRVVAGTAANPSQPAEENRVTGVADYTGVPIFSIELPELVMPVDVNLPEARAKAEVQADLEDVTITGIMQASGQEFLFGALSFHIPGQWFSDTFGQELCGAVPQLCEQGLSGEVENLTGERRDDAQW